MPNNIDVRMDFDMVRDMVNTFEACSRQMDSTIASVEKIASTLEAGALLGLAGDAFSDALRARLTNRLERLRDKFEELARDVDAARAFLEEADDTAASRFL